MKEDHDYRQLQHKKKSKGMLQNYFCIQSKTYYSEYLIYS